MLADPIAENHAVLTQAEKTAVQEQFERLLASSYFSHSKRFPTFLRFVVQHALAGQGDLLKERTLGIEIFGRSPDYDTAADPIVRVTAAEIRKRIAQYYQEPGRENEIRVSMLSGSYVPHFQWPHPPEAHVEQAPAELHSLSEEPASEETSYRPSPSTRWSIAVVMVLAVVIASAALVLVWKSTQRSPFDFFWGPVLSSSDPVLFCIADQNMYSEIALRDASDPTHQSILKDNLSAVVMTDLTPIVKIAGLMQASGKKYSLKGEGLTNLTDLRNGPTVFVGAFDNAWTLRLTKPLRYHFANNADMTRFWIADSDHPDRIDWVIDRAKQQATNNYRDYAIVTQFTDGNTGKIAIVAAGVGRGGTIAAGEFLIDTAHLTQIVNAARASAGKKNMEFVLSTEIIDGQPGTPKMEAAYFW